MSWPATNDELEALGQLIVEGAGGAIGSYAVSFGELNLRGPAHRVTAALTHLRDNPDLQFAQLIDICGADYPQRALRFDVVYHLLSLTKNRRVRLTVETDEDTPVPSAVGVFPCADWFERE